MTISIPNHPDRYPLAAHKSRLLHSNPYLSMLSALQQETDQFHKSFQPLRDLQEAIERVLEPTPEEILTISEEALTIESLSPLFRFEAERYATFPLYNSPALALNTGAVTGWTLINHPRLLVLLLVFDGHEFEAQNKLGKVTTSINFAAGDISFRLLKTDGFTCSHWHAPLISDETVASHNLMCRSLGSRTYQENDCIRLRGGEEAIVYEQVGSSTVALQTYCRILRTNVMADYDPSTHHLRSVSAADQRSSRLQLLASLMRLFDRQEAVPELEKLLEHPDHFVRWQTAREMTALSPQAAEAGLYHLALSDPNPAVRQHARDTLTRFYAHKEAS